jgi:hypothetical protein
LRSFTRHKESIACEIWPIGHQRNLLASPAPRSGAVLEDLTRPTHEIEEIVNEATALATVQHHDEQLKAESAEFRAFQEQPAESQAVTEQHGLDAAVEPIAGRICACARNLFSHESTDFKGLTRTDNKSDIMGKQQSFETCEIPDDLRK